MLSWFPCLFPRSILGHLPASVPWELGWWMAPPRILASGQKGRTNRKLEGWRKERLRCFRLSSSHRSGFSPWFSAHRGSLVPYLVPSALGGRNSFLLFCLWLPRQLPIFYLLPQFCPSSGSSAFFTVPLFEPSGMDSISCWDPYGYRYEPAIQEEESQIFNKDNNTLNLTCTQRNPNLSNNEVEFLTHSHGRKVRALTVIWGNAGECLTLL